MHAIKNEKLYSNWTVTKHLFCKWAYFLVVTIIVYSQQYIFQCKEELAYFIFQFLKYLPGYMILKQNHMLYFTYNCPIIFKWNTGVEGCKLERVGGGGECLTLSLMIIFLLITMHHTSLLLWDTILTTSWFPEWRESSWGKLFCLQK